MSAFDSEHDMTSAVERRTHRVYARTTHGISNHNRYWNACANDERDDPLATARGIWNGIVIGGAIWALIAVGVWALSMLWGA